MAARRRDSTRLIKDGAALIALDAALIRIYAVMREIREEEPIAASISRPPVPSRLSESLVAAAAPVLFGRGAVAESGGAAADLRIMSHDRPNRLVEVKATGAWGFQEIKDRDLAPDVLVWVAFGSRYELGAGPIDMFVLPEPQRFVRPCTRGGSPKTKFMLPDFLAAARELPGFAGWRFADLADVLGNAPPTLWSARSTTHAPLRLEI